MTTDESNAAYKAAARIAQAYDPAQDAAVEHLSRAPFPLTPAQRMAVGYHRSAQTAANENTKDNNQ
jgi:hypothetical protein